MKTLLAFEGAEILWTQDIGAASEYDQAGEAPFNQAINVYGEGVPA